MEAISKVEIAGLCESPARLFVVNQRKTKSGPSGSISRFVLDLNPTLFNFLAAAMSPLNALHARVALVLETTQIENQVRDVGLDGGRPFYSMKPTSRAFVAKALLNISTTKALIDRLEVDDQLRCLCGFSHGKVPSESTFSRHFRALCVDGVLDRTHENLVRSYVGSETVHHLSRDSSAIDGREKPQRKAKAAPTPKKKTGRPRKGAEPVYRGVSRLQTQMGQDYKTSLAQLPQVCDIGSKTNSKGHSSHWIGFKLHLDVADNGLPISCFTSSASLHDSQVAIPLSQMTRERVGGVFYELMDKAYDAEGIKNAVRTLGHVPIIQPASRGKHQPAPLDDAQAQRFKNRTAVERTFSALKENHGARFVRVRSPQKVHTHLMFGVITVFALILLGI